MNDSPQTIFRWYLCVYLFGISTSTFIEISRNGLELVALLRPTLLLVVGLIVPVLFFYKVLHRQPLELWSFSYNPKRDEGLRAVYLLASGLVGWCFAFYALFHS
jgi:hypothetical protein